MAHEIQHTTGTTCLQVAVPQGSHVRSHEAMELASRLVCFDWHHYLSVQKQCLRNDEI